MLKALEQTFLATPLVDGCVGASIVSPNGVASHTPRRSVNPARGSRGKCCQILRGKLLSLPGKQTTAQMLICETSGQRTDLISRICFVFMEQILFFFPDSLKESRGKNESETFHYTATA